MNRISGSPRRRKAVTLIEAVLFISIAMAVIVGGLVFYQQASLAMKVMNVKRHVQAAIAETRVIQRQTNAWSYRIRHVVDSNRNHRCAGRLRCLGPNFQRIWKYGDRVCHCEARTWYHTAGWWPPSRGHLWCHHVGGPLSRTFPSVPAPEWSSPMKPSGDFCPSGKIAVATEFIRLPPDLDANPIWRDRTDHAARRGQTSAAMAAMCQLRAR
jgi:hypothetical protein